MKRERPKNFLLDKSRVTGYITIPMWIGQHNNSEYTMMEILKDFAHAFFSIFWTDEALIVQAVLLVYLVHFL